MTHTTNTEKRFSKRFVFTWDDSKTFKMMWRINEDGTMSICTNEDLKAFIASEKQLLLDEVVKEVNLGFLVQHPDFKGWWISVDDVITLLKEKGNI